LANFAAIESASAAMRLQHGAIGAGVSSRFNLDTVG
jgi:hypothetical protein